MLSRRTPLRRRTRLAPLNRQRRARLMKRAFAEQAQLCRSMPCLVCWHSPCDPHHEPPRSVGGRDCDTVPLCREHHDARHRLGKAEFERRTGVDLLAEARRLRTVLAVPWEELR